MVTQYDSGGFQTQTAQKHIDEGTIHYVVKKIQEREAVPKKSIMRYRVFSAVGDSIKATVYRVYHAKFPHPY